MLNRMLGGLFEKRKVLLEYACYLFIIVFVLYIAPNFLIEKIVIDGSSMQNALQDGDQVLIEKVSRYFNGPDRFDIVVFTKKTGTTEKVYIKRIIGMPGDTVQILSGIIFINGEILEENYGKDAMLTDGIAQEPIVLGEDEYFVLGDHRSVSVDSRSERVGVVKKSELDGVVILRVFPLNSIGKVD